MTPDGVLRWWPPIGIALMVVLGRLVGGGSTRLDDWFISTGESHPSVDALLVFTQPLVLVILLLTAVLVAAYRRRWRLVVVVVLTPAVAVVAARLVKELFGREKGSSLAYPSGHVTAMVAVLGMLVLMAGARRWMLGAAAVFALLGIAGQALTYHYFTDTVGAAFLGTALVGIAFAAAGLDRCQPRCDLHHSDG
ncbi:MAG: phosphatase PAP2 family protein [Mycobacterium sp.]